MLKAGSKVTCFLCVLCPFYSLFVFLTFSRLSNSNNSVYTWAPDPVANVVPGILHNAPGAGTWERSSRRRNDPSAPRNWNLGEMTIINDVREGPPKTLQWFTSYEGFARQFQMFSCMVKYAEDTRRTLLLSRFESKHYKRGTDRDAGLPYMDEIIDLDRLYNGDISQPFIKRIPRPDRSKNQKNSAKCEKSIGVKIKWEDDDYDVDPVKAERMGVKARCPKSDMKCRAEFDKPKYVRIQGTENPEYFDGHPDKYKGVNELCVSSLPLPLCKAYVPAVFAPRYESMYEDFKEEILGGFGGEYAAVHMRRGDRCSEDYKGKRDILYKSGACGPIKGWVESLRAALSSDRYLPVYVATDDTSPATRSLLEKEGFHVLASFVDQYPSGVDYGGELLTDLDFFLIDMQMLIHAKRSFAVQAWSTVSEVVDDTRRTMLLDSVEVLKAK